MTKRVLSVSIERKLVQELEKEWEEKRNPSSRYKLSFSQFLENILKERNKVPENTIPMDLYEELRERWDRYNSNRLEDITFEEFLRKELG